MRTTTAIPTALQVLMNHIYELHKGVRHMVLFTCNKKYSEQTIKRLESQGIPYLLQPAGHGGYPAHSHPSAKRTHARGGLHPRCYARLRHLRTVRKILQAQINNFLK